MTQKEMYNKYVKEECVNCLNKDKDLCEIRKNVKGELQCVYKRMSNNK